MLPVFAWIVGGQLELIAEPLNLLLGTDITAGALTSGIRPWVIGFVAALGLFGCVALHEFGHSLMAMAYDYEIESITLWLLGGLARPAEPPTNWWHELWIAIAGPIVSIARGVICGIVAIIMPAT